MSWGFLNTHSSTAERVLRGKKVAEEIACMEKKRVTEVAKRS